MTEDQSRKKEWLLLGLILLLGLGLRLWGIRFGLPYKYWTEEYKVLNYALRMGSGDLNPHFFEYPTFYLYLTLFVCGLHFVWGKVTGLYQNSHDFAVSFVRDPSSLYLLVRFMETFWGLALIALTYFIAKRHFGKKAGLWAALLTALLPHFVMMGHVIKGDTAATVFSLLVLGAGLEIARRGLLKDYLLFGAALGLAVTTKYYTAPMAALMPLAHWFCLRKTPSWSWKKYFLKREPWLAAAVSILVFFVASPYALLDWPSFWNDIKDIRSPWTTVVENMGKVNYLFAFRSWLEIAGMIRNGAPWLGLFCLGAIAWHWRRRTQSLALWLLPIGIYTAIILPTPIVWGYMLPMFPSFLILAGGFLGAASTWPQINHRRTIQGLGALVAAGCLTKSLFLDYGMSLKDPRTEAKEWIETNVPKGSKILMGNYPYSPPLLSSYEQLQDQYKKATELKHYKAQYLKLQIEAHPGAGSGYELYTVGIPPRMVGTLMHRAQEAQQVQNLVSYEEGIDPLRRLGISYVITNKFDEDNASFVKNQKLVDFYRTLRSEAQLIKEVPPRSSWAVGPVIYIFQI